MEPFCWNYRKKSVGNLHYHYVKDFVVESVYTVCLFICSNIKKKKEPWTDYLRNHKWLEVADQGLNTDFSISLVKIVKPHYEQNIPLQFLQTEGILCNWTL